jgi:hypothetical protein
VTLWRVTLSNEHDGAEQVQVETRHVFELTNQELLRRGVIARQLLLQFGYHIVETAAPLADDDVRKGVYRYRIEIMTASGQLINSFEDTSYPMLTGGLLSAFVYDEGGSRIKVQHAGEVPEFGAAPKRRKK